MAYKKSNKNLKHQKDHHGGSEQPEKPTGTTDPQQGATGREITPENTLTRDVIATIRQIINDDELADFAARNFKTREDHTINGSEDRVYNPINWFTMVYLANRRLNKLTEADKEDFKRFYNNAAVKMITGSGYSNQAVTCPGNILSDISRLEVLIGGKRVGNNSDEIINEAADICRRLFAGGVMDINVYPELIAELTENHRGAYGYYSD